MFNSVFGKKIGMTQIFLPSGTLVPVTVVDVANWFVTQIKTPQKDGYAALQLGLLKKKYLSELFNVSWLRNKKRFFSHIHEIKVDQAILDKIEIGKKIELDNINFEENNIVKVTGNSTGLGFQGVVKRWNFGGGPKAHGSNFHRIPGAIGGLRAEGEVIKGKKMPGQTGNEGVTILGLNVVKLDKQNNCLFIKGAIPGRKDSVVMVSRQG